MTPVALAVSPHLDDAAFSAGGTLAVLAARGWRVVVATLFTRSMADPQGFALACQLDKGLGPEVDYMALRRAEDMAAMAALAAEPVHCAFPEAPHRGYGSAPALFGPPDPGDEVVPALTEALRTLLGTYRPDLLLAPQAIGGHVDHVQTVRALHVAAPAVPTWWWRDFPYDARPGVPAEPFGGDFAAVPERAVALDSVAMGAKARACAAYLSQLGFQFGGEDGLRKALAQAGATERFRGWPDIPAVA